MATENHTGTARLLHSRPALVRAKLAHSYLDNRLRRLSETSFARLLEEQPQICEELRLLLAEMEATFVDGYEPSALVDLPAMCALSTESRERLVASVKAAFAARFRPEERLATVSATGQIFIQALDAWRRAVRQDSVGAGSASLWGELRERAAELLEVLRDPELRTRWIP